MPENSAHNDTSTISKAAFLLLLEKINELGVGTGTFVPRSHRPTYRKNEVRLVDLFKQKLKEKIADLLADSVLRDPEERKLVIGMFMTESIQERARSNDSDEFSGWVSRKTGQYRTP